MQPAVVAAVKSAVARNSICFARSALLRGNVNIGLRAPEADE